MQRSYGLCSQWLLGLLLISLSMQQAVDWSALPSVRAGQIDSIVTLTTSSDTSPSVTDITTGYLNDITGATAVQLSTGLSLSSYESWMTDTFSFNITLVAVSITDITVRFLVLENTFFTRAKVHYLVVWNNKAIGKNGYFSGTPPISPTSSPQAYNYIEVLYGCYLTADLRAGSPNQTVGGLSSTIHALNPLSLVQTNFVGMKLSNSVGLNNYVDVQTSFNATSGVLYTVSVQANNFLTEICLTTVMVDPSVSDYSSISIIEFQTISLNATNAGLDNVPYSERFDGPHRMFFGFSRFNLSMADTRYLNVETSNISLVSLLYDKNNAMNEVHINMLFFARRTCHDLNQYYYPPTFECVSSCSTHPKSVTFGTPVPSNYLLCKPCHYSCAQCTEGQKEDKCTLCNSNSPSSTANRHLDSNNCVCNTGFTDIGNQECVPCNYTMPGCLTCLSSTFCQTCNTSMYNSVPDPASHQCQCSNTSHFLVTGFCLPYAGCIRAQLFNNLQVCTACDSSQNFIRNDTTLECECNEGYKYNINISRPYQCQDDCGDGMTAKGHCDDGNKLAGDGCDENCNVESGYHCSPTNPNNNSSISKCVLITPVSVTYLYAERTVNTNKFTMAFKLSPPQPNLNAASFTSSNFKTTLPVQNQAISYDPATGTVYLAAEYLQSIEGASQKVTVSFLNNIDFYAEDTTAQFTSTGINAQLVLEETCAYNTILQYVVMGEGVLAILLALFASIVGLKLAGIELLMPVQLIYFSLAALEKRPSYVSTLNNLKYANGYSGILNYDYFRTYSQNSKLAGMQYETEFLLSSNTMIGVFLLSLVWLLLHHLKIKYKERKLDAYLRELALQEEMQPQKHRENQSDSSDDHKDDGEHDEEKVKLRRAPKDSASSLRQNQLRQDHHYSFKIFSFQVDRFYFIFYLILVNQLLFGFNVMTLDLPMGSFHFPQQLSVIVCNFMLFLLMGNVVFIFYDQQSNKMISFTCINDRYAYLYLILDALTLLLLSFAFQQPIAVYLVTALSALFPVLVLIERPYSKFLRDFQNLVALYLQLMLLSCLVLLSVVQSSALTEKVSLMLACLIVGLVMIGEVLTAIRIGLKVNFKKAFDDLKSPFSGKDDDEKEKRRVLEKNLDLLGKDSAEIVPPDSVRNGLFTPKDKMIDWEARNTEEYQSLRQRDKESPTGEGTQEQQALESQSDHNEDPSDKDDKLNELEVLKKKLRNNLRLKRENESKKAD